MVTDDAAATFGGPGGGPLTCSTYLGMQIPILNYRRAWYIIAMVVSRDSQSYRSYGNEV